MSKTKIDLHQMIPMFNNRYFIFLTHEEKVKWETTGRIDPDEETGYIMAYKNPDVVFQSKKELIEDFKIYIVPFMEQDLLRVGFEDGISDECEYLVSEKSFDADMVDFYAMFTLSVLADCNERRTMEKENICKSEFTF